MEFQAAIGVQRQDSRPDSGPDRTRDDVFGSATVLLPSGFSLSGALGHRDTEGQSFDTSYGYIKAGYERRFASFGATALSVDYFGGSDYVEKGDSSHAWGLGLVQDVDALNGELYLGYRSNHYDQKDTNFDTVDTVLLGARFRF